MDTSSSAKADYRAILAWSLAVSFYFYQFLLQVIPSVLKSQIQGSFGLNSEQFGLMAAYFLYAYAAMQIPAGVILDRYGPKKVLPFAIAICALGAECVALAENPALATMGRIITGLGSAFAVIGCFKVAAMAFAPKHFSLMTGLTVMIGMSGAAFGQSLVGPFIHSLSRWQDAFHIFFALGMLISVAIAIIMPQSDLRYAKFSWVELLKQLLKVCSDPLTLVAALFAGLMYVPTLAIGEAWGIAFLVEGYGISPLIAHQTVPLLFLGWACGSVLFGLASAYLPRSVLMSLSALAVWALSAVFTHTGLSHWTALEWGSLFFVLGVCSAGFILAFTSAKEAHHESLAATTSGVMNTANTLCGAIMQQVIGYRLDQSLVLHQRTTPLLVDYHYALDVVVRSTALSFVLAVILALMEYRKHQKIV